MWKTMCILIVENYALCESLPRTVAWESAFHLALRNCSKEVKEEPGYRGIFTGRKKNKPSCSQKSKDYCWSQKQTSKDSSVFLCMRRCKSVSSVAQSCPTLWPHGLQHTRLPCPSPTLRVYSSSRPLSWWCHPTILSCQPLLLPPSIFPSIRVFSNESTLRMRWPKYWSFSLSISPSKRTPRTDLL